MQLGREKFSPYETVGTVEQKCQDVEFRDKLKYVQDLSWFFEKNNFGFNIINEKMSASQFILKSDYYYLT